MAKQTSVGGVWTENPSKRKPHKAAKNPKRRRKMKRNIRNKVTLLCCGLAGACCLLGASLSIDMANVSAEETAVTMVAGAATRKDLENPGLKFTANITNYTESVNYGMLILPEQAFTKFTFNNDYVDVLDEAGKTYINKICTPYEVSEGQWQIACSIVDIYEDNYTRQFVGVAYALADGNYSYADVNMLDNARSVTYVAQMALQYETGLTEDETHALETFANPKCLLEETVEVDGIEDAGLTFGGEASLAGAPYMARQPQPHYQESISSPRCPRRSPHCRRSPLPQGLRNRHRSTHCFQW